MGVLHSQQRHHHCHYVTAFFTFLLFSSASASIIATSQLGGKEALERVLSQKRLGGPGSSPPTCRSKCGRCSPCKPVHVPIQPGVSIPLEYYPEAWRCLLWDRMEVKAYPNDKETLNPT
ncbi:hypothetical protein FNV43_RR01592 [Rhamnella rubrinervis]|uniref:Epidermal patterning factor-like protein n=1 Tax=Rhamnella rubrinervis TaxID=2594499 RepID=A0A8K0MT47_9ROSA|nr:hypothetical protein FNV43_RR01592 [Rhamnella rubrinervis]